MLHLITWHRCMMPQFGELLLSSKHLSFMFLSSRPLSYMLIIYFIKSLPVWRGIYVLVQKLFLIIAPVIG